MRGHEASEENSRSNSAAGDYEVARSPRPRAPARLPRRCCAPAQRRPPPLPLQHGGVMLHKRSSSGLVPGSAHRRSAEDYGDKSAPAPALAPAHAHAPAPARLSMDSRTAGRARFFVRSWHDLDPDAPPPWDRQDMGGRESPAVGGTLGRRGRFYPPSAATSDPCGAPGPARR